MNIALLFLGLQVLCLCSAFGLAYTFLKNTSYRHLSLLLAPVLFPACLVLMETLCGHSIPKSLPYAVPLLITVALLLYSGVVVWREWGGLVSIRWDLLKAGGILLAATLLGMTSIAADIAHGSLTYIDFQINNELLNYAALAGHLMGRTINQVYAADYGHYITSRSGADLLLASFAHGAGAPPANCIDLLIALLRSHAVAAFSLLLLRATKGGIGKRPVVLYSGLTLFGLCSLQLLSYASSFLSQYGVAPLLILCAAFLIQEEDVLNLRVLGLLTLLYVCIYISYPEIMPLLIFIQGGQALLLALRQRSMRLFWMALSPFAAAFLVNPALVISRARFLMDLAGAQAGFVMFVPASDNPIAYAATLLGLRFPYLGLKAFNEPWTETVIAIALLIYAAAALYLVFRRGRQNWALSIAVLLIVCTAVTWISHPSKNGPTAIYKAEKSLMYVHFLLVAALILAVAEPPRKQIWRGLVVTAYLVILIANFRLSAEVVGQSASWRTVFPLADVTRAVQIFRSGIAVGLPTGNGISSMYWNGVLQYFGITRRYIDPLTRAQCGTVFDAVDEPDAPPASPRERGAIIVDSYRTVLSTAGLATLPTNLRQQNVLFRAPSFVVYDGPLSDQVEHFSALLRVRTHQLGSIKVPLLTTGQQLKGSILYLNKLSLGHYRVELDVWYTAHKDGEDLTAAADPKGQDEILVEGQGSGISYTVTVTVNGHAALQYNGLFGGVGARTLFWAKNPIDFPQVAPVCEICTVGQVEINHDAQR